MEKDELKAENERLRARCIALERELAAKNERVRHIVLEAAEAILREAGKVKALRAELDQRA